MSRTPPFPSGDIKQWALKLYEYLNYDSPIGGRVDPTPVLLPHRVDSRLERASVDGILLYDPVLQSVVVSKAGAWQPIADTASLSGNVTIAVGGVSSIATPVFPTKATELNCQFYAVNAAAGAEVRLGFTALPVSFTYNRTTLLNAAAVQSVNATEATLLVNTDAAACSISGGISFVRTDSSWSYFGQLRRSTGGTVLISGQTDVTGGPTSITILSGVNFTSGVFAVRWRK